jgi:choline dehydrogenase
MQSGIGDEQELKRFEIPVVQHLPGVGKNLQDHPIVAGCIWESKEPPEVRNNAGEATFFWKSDSSLDTPDLQPLQLEVPLTTPQLAHIALPQRACTILPGLVRPKSQGQLHLTGADPFDPLEIELNAFSDPADMKAMMTCVELCRDIGNSSALRPFAEREVMPGGLRGAALEEFIRDATVTYRHQTCTAKMGTDAMSVVDSNLAVYGIDGLRISDGSILPRIPTGNTMAPCVIVGERCGEILQNKYGL